VVQLAEGVKGKGIGKRGKKVMKYLSMLKNLVLIYGF